MDDPLHRFAKERAQEDAILWGVRAISWEYLEHYVHSTSRRLKELGIKKGTRVLLIPSPSPASVIVLLALWKAGGIVGCLESELPLKTALETTSFDFLISDKPLAASIRQGRIEDMIVLETVEHFFALSSRKDHDLDMSALAVLIWKNDFSVGEFSLEDILSGRSKLPAGSLFLQKVFTRLLSGEPFAIDKS